MEFFPFKPVGKNDQYQITYNNIKAAMDDALKGSKIKQAGRKYAVMNPENGATFSPKEVIRSIIGRHERFSGGKGFGGANQVFQAFGFPLGKKQELDGKRQELKKRIKRSFSANGLLRKLFSQEWSLLPTKSEMKAIPNGKYPGVYVLAYSDEFLVGKRVLEKDIFYVGMTVEGGLSTRLYQFYSGIVGGSGHSAGQRFYRVWLRRMRYDRNAKTKLYFACLPVMCEAVKEWRTSEDLRKLGTVTELEYAVIARVKRKLGHEPLLNKK